MKYAINKEFGIYRHFKPPTNAVMLRLADGVLSAMPKGMRSSKMLVAEKVKVPCGDRQVCAYVISPRTAEKSPKQTIFYFHGGGFIFRGAPYHYKLTRLYAQNAKSQVIFVDYALAFSAKHHDPLGDCVCTCNYFLDNHEKYKINLDNFCLAGDSAGGYLCLAVLEKLKDQNQPLPNKMMLIYPVVDSDADTESMKKFQDTPMWNAKLNAKMWKIYSRAGEVLHPLKADVSAFPSTYIETAEFDCLHDEAVMLADKIKSAGVPCILNETKGTMHGYDICLNSLAAQQAIAERIKFLKS